MVTLYTSMRVHVEKMWDKVDFEVNGFSMLLCQ